MVSDSIHTDKQVMHPAVQLAAVLFNLDTTIKYTAFVIQQQSCTVINENVRRKKLIDRYSYFKMSFKNMIILKAETSDSVMETTNMYTICVTAPPYLNQTI